VRAVAAGEVDLEAPAQAVVAEVVAAPQARAQGIEGAALPEQAPPVPTTTIITELAAVRGMQRVPMEPLPPIQVCLRPPHPRAVVQERQIHRLLALTPVRAHRLNLAFLLQPPRHQARPRALRARELRLLRRTGLLPGRELRQIRRIRTSWVGNKSRKPGDQDPTFLRNNPGKSIDYITLNRMIKPVRVMSYWRKVL
jgi:hypothetical protein